MTQAGTPTGPASEPTKKDHGRAGRDLPAAVGSAVVLLGAVALSLAFWKPAFMLIVAAALIVAIWELHRGFVEVSGNKVSILSDTAELGPDIDVARAQEAKARAEERLRHEDDAEAISALSRADARLRAAGQNV